MFIIVSAMKRSSFGWLVLTTEYYYLFGLGVFPIILGFGLTDGPALFSDYISNYGGFSVGTFFHISFYGVGALFGYYLARPITNRVSRRIIYFAAKNRINNYKWFYLVSGVSIIFSFLYFYFVGKEAALVNASLVRGGDLSGL